jgi:alcohol dehydrogenase
MTLISQTNLPMRSFGLVRQPNELLFGEGQSGATADVALGLGSRVAIVTDERAAAEPFFTAITDQLTDGASAVTLFTGTEPDLPLANIDRAVAALAPGEPDVIVGIGGGSCIDLAKVTALTLAHGGRPSDYYGEFRVPGPTIPVVAVPTTAGTGSEATAVAVINDPDMAVKVGISSPYLIPRSAVVDPSLTDEAPSWLTATTGIDALAHLIESFTAVRRQPSTDLRRANVFVGKGMLTDLYCREGMILVGAGLRDAVNVGGPGLHRTNMMAAALYGGLALGTAGTAIAHALQYPVGSLTHTPHGLGIGTLLPYAMAFNGRAVVNEMAVIAEALGTERTDDPVRAAVRAVADLAQDIGIPLTLAEIGVRAKDLPWIAEQSLRAARLVNNNPIPFDLAAARLVTEAAFAGDLDRLLSHTNYRSASQ